MAEWFLSAMTIYGPFVLGLAALLGGLGLPIPSPLLLVAAGAFVRQGLLDWRLVIAWSLAGTILGENAGFAAGRLAGDWVERRLGSLFAATWGKAQERFREHGAWAIYLTRVLLTPLAVPTNLIAGSSSYRIERFLLAALVGDLSWILIYGGLGYFFGDRWAAVSKIVSTYSSWLIGLVAVGIGLYYLVRHLRQSPRRSLAYRLES